MNGHFEFVEMSLGGMPIGERITVTTVTGILLNCPPKIDEAHVARMAEIARQTPDYPCDISVSHGDDIEWCARIYWREHNG